MTTDHRDVRASLGAWVLGALDGSERREVEAHLATCDECAAEVAALSPLPGLLNRVTEEEVEHSSLVPDDDLRDRLIAEVEASEASLRTRVRRLRRVVAGVGVVAAAAVIVAVLALAGVFENEPTFDRVVAPVAAVAADAEDTTGEAAAFAWEWGTTVELDVADLPAREAYVMWAVADDGQRQQAGTWGATEQRGALVRGACSIQRQDLARVEVTDASGVLLLEFDF